MEFSFTREEEAFRQEIRGFLRDEMPDQEGGVLGALGEGGEERWAAQLVFQKKLAAKGYLTLGWPQDHGGMGASHMMQVIYNEEMTYHRAPTQLGVGPDRVGPTIILYGSDEQKARYLPGITAAEEVWCQGFSEPGAGSDLASLETRAVADADEFVVNGQKIWTSFAHKADYCILLARTDQDAPKHKGISYFILDMKTPGIEIRPLVDMLGRHTFNQLFFENVRIPRDCLMGELNRGWYVAAATLDFERSGINRVVAGYRTLEELLEWAAQASRNGGRVIEEGPVRNKLAELAIEFQTGRMLAYRVASMQAKGQIPNAEASMSKLFGSELQQRLGGAGMQILGTAGMLEPGSGWAPLGGRLEQYYLFAAALTVAAGTSEIQRGIIAGRGLSLPRG